MNQTTLCPEDALTEGWNYLENLRTARSQVPASDVVYMLEQMIDIYEARLLQCVPTYAESESLEAVSADFSSNESIIAYYTFEGDQWIRHETNITTLASRVSVTGVMIRDNGLYFRIVHPDIAGEIWVFETFITSKLSTDFSGLQLYDAQMRPYTAGFGEWATSAVPVPVGFEVENGLDSEHLEYRDGIWYLRGTDIQVFIDAAGYIRDSQGNYYLDVSWEQADGQMRTTQVVMTKTDGRLGMIIPSDAVTLNLDIIDDPRLKNALRQVGVEDTGLITWEELLQGKPDIPVECNEETNKNTPRCQEALANYANWLNPRLEYIRRIQAENTYLSLLIANQVTRPVEPLTLGELVAIIYRGEYGIYDQVPGIGYSENLLQAIIRNIFDAGSYGFCPNGECTFEQAVKFLGTVESFYNRAHQNDVSVEKYLNYLGTEETTFIDVQEAGRGLFGNPTPNSAGVYFWESTLQASQALDNSDNSLWHSGQSPNAPSRWGNVVITDVAVVSKLNSISNPSQFTSADIQIINSTVNTVKSVIEGGGATVFELTYLCYSTSCLEVFVVISSQGGVTVGYCCSQDPQANRINRKVFPS